MSVLPTQPTAGMTEAERFRHFVANVTDYAIYMLSPEGLVDSWNAGAQRFKGYTAEEIVGRHFSTFFRDEDRAAGLPQRALEAAARDGRFESEGWRVRKDGTQFWASVVVDAIRGDGGELIGYAKITRDITERREAALALERTQAALMQAQKFEAIGKLTGGVAHDFNNLLGVVVTGIELLSHGNPTPQQAKILDSMQRAASRGALLTQQLLAFARAQPLIQEKHNLNQVLGGFEAVLRRACEATIRFDMIQAPDLPPVLVDATQFEAAVLNLVTNARDAMPDGGTLTVGTASVHLAQGQVGALPAGRYVRVTVRDTGAGMTPDVVAHAIDPFYTTKGPGKGTGLGLSQVYGFVQQSGGDLTIESAPGQGTTIAFYLPAAEDTAGATAQAAGDAERALVVDDQPDVLDMAVELFRMMGYEVLSANSGVDALDILQRNENIDVLFSDIVMPGVDGVTLARQARQHKPDMKIILASGYPPPSLTDGDAALRDFDFVSKPYRVAELMKLLRHAA